MNQSASAIVAGVGPVRGLGAALASCFAEKGLHVFIAGRSAEKLDEVVQHIRTSGGSVTPVVADITVEDDVPIVQIMSSTWRGYRIAVYNVDSNVTPMETSETLLSYGDKIVSARSCLPNKPSILCKHMVMAHYFHRCNRHRARRLSAFASAKPL